MDQNVHAVRVASAHASAAKVNTSHVHVDQTATVDQIAHAALEVNVNARRDASAAKVNTHHVHVDQIATADQTAHAAMEVNVNARRDANAAKVVNANAASIR